MTLSYALKDANFIEAKALPNGANTIYSTGFDLGSLSQNGARVAEIEGEIVAPALVVGDLADGATMKYSIQTATDAAFTSPVTVAADVLIQTGAGGAGAAAATQRYRLPSDCLQFVRIRAINSGAGDASDKSLTHRLLF